MTIKKKVWTWWCFFSVWNKDELEFFYLFIWRKPTTTFIRVFFFNRALKLYKFVLFKLLLFIYSCCKQYFFYILKKKSWNQKNDVTQNEWLLVILRGRRVVSERCFYFLCDINIGNGGTLTKGLLIKEGSPSRDRNFDFRSNFVEKNKNRNSISCLQVMKVLFVCVWICVLFWRSQFSTEIRIFMCVCSMNEYYIACNF